MTPGQRRDIVQQSDALYRKTTRAGQPESVRRRNAKRRAERYSAKPRETRVEQRPPDEVSEFWNEYQKAVQ